MVWRSAALAEASGAALGFEAAVAGGIPIVKTLRESLAGNEVSRVSGILNGTCNYILSRMEQEGLGFAEVLADAQRLGYAEADPDVRRRRLRHRPQARDPHEPRLSARRSMRKRSMSRASAPSRRSI